MLKTEFTLTDLFGVMYDVIDKNVLITTMLGSFSFKAFGKLESVDAWGLEETDRVKLTLENQTTIELYNDKILDMNYNEFVLSRNNTKEITVALEGHIITIEFEAI